MIIKAKMTGFTLVETLVAVAIMGLVIAGATSMFFFVLKGEKKADTRIKVKQSGDFALSVMSSTIRNADSITTVCDGTQKPSISVGPTTFAVSAGQITSNGQPLTSSEYVISTLNPFLCTRYPDKPKVVTITFTLARVGLTEESTQQTFQTTVSLRNY